MALAVPAEVPRCCMPYCSVSYETLADLILQTPTAELEPITKEYVQSVMLLFAARFKTEPANYC
jgi:hypothetical protein